MRFGLTETQQLLKNSAREFLSAELPSREVRRLMETGAAHDAELWGKFAAHGWTGIIFPEEHGGMALGMVELAATMEEMGRALVPGPYLSTVLLAGMAIHAAASKEQQRKYLAPICRGEALSTLALLEAGAHWSVDAVQMTATPAQAGFRLTGSKYFVTDAAAARFIFVVARIGSDLALFAVENGYRATAMPAIDATRKLYQVDFEAVEVRTHSLLARGERARAAIEHALDVATVGLVAEMTGGMQRVLDMTVAYAKTRKQFGKPIGQFQAVQHLCADMLLLTESSRSAAYYAAYAVNEGLADAQAAVSVAKSYASDAYREVGNKGIQVHGGMGFTWENDIHLYYRRAKASELLFGDATFHRERIARLILDRPRAVAAHNEGD